MGAFISGYQFGIILAPYRAPVVNAVRIVDRHTQN